MISKEEKKRRRDIVQAMVAKDTQEAIAVMPISLKNLEQLFDFLDIRLSDGCDHTPKITLEFLTDANLDSEQILPWLQEQGGYCDCEILANVEEGWEREIKNRLNRDL